MKPVAPITLKAFLTRLRGLSGCPWDKGQTHHSLAEFFREEAAEALDAIAAYNPNDPLSEAHLCEELGDVWLQIAFHAQIASERGAFDIHDVESAVAAKLLRRHPHVFSDISVADSEEALLNWQAAKRQEKLAVVAENGLLGDMPANLSSLDAAMEIGRRCARVGFEWADVGGVVEKIREEIAELAAESDQGRVESEFGDLMFCLVQWARHRGIDPDLALRRQMARFRERFKHVEKAALDANGWENINLDEMETVWTKAKLAMLEHEQLP